jgi:hypothetical protein
MKEKLGDLCGKLFIMKELHPNLNEEDKDLIEKILSAGDIKHKYAVRLQTVYRA